jgi:hypothetical protein
VGVPVTAEWKRRSPDAEFPQGLHVDICGLSCTVWPIDHSPVAWEWWLLGDEGAGSSEGLMVGGTNTEPPAGLLPLVELIAATLAAAREAASNQRPAPAAPQEDGHVRST